MADLGELKAILRVDSTSLDTTMAKAKAFGSGLGPAMLGGAALAAVGFAAVTVKMATSFQTLTTQLVTGAGESVKNIDMIRTGILNMASEVGAAPDALAKGLYNIESAGYHGAAALDILRISAEGAKVGAADQATVADAVTTALNAYHLGAGKAAAVTNDLITAVSLGKTHMQDLASSLGTIVPIASALQVSLPQVTAAMATMTTQGTDSHLAATSLRFLMASLAGPTTAAAGEMEGLGIGAKEIPKITKATTDALSKLGIHTSEVAATLADPQKGLPAALTMITDAIGKKFPKGSAQYEAALKGAVGGTRGLTAALELTGPNMATYLSNINNINSAVDKGGTKVQGWALIQQDFGQKLDQLKGGFQAAAIGIGDALLPKLGQFADWVSHNQGAITNVAHEIGVVLVGAMSKVGDVVQWAIDHKDVVLGIGAAIASWWAVDKIATWEGQVMSSFQRIGNSNVIGRLFGGGGGSAVAGVASAAKPVPVFVENWAMMGGAGAVGAGEGAVAGSAGGGGLLARVGMGSLVADTGTVAGIMAGAAVAVPTLVGGSLGILAGLGAWALYAQEGADQAHRAANGFGLSADAVDSLTQALHSGAGQKMSPTDAANLLAQTMSEAGASSQTINDALSAAAAPMSNGILNTEQSITYFAQNFGKAGETTYQILQEFQGLNAAQIAAFPQTIAAFTNVTEHMGKVDLSTSALDKAFAGVAGLPPGGVLQDFTNLQKSIHNATDAANALSGKFGVGNSTNLGGGPGNTGSASPSKSVTIHIQPGATLKPADLSNALGWVLTHG